MMNRRQFVAAGSAALALTQARPAQALTSGAATANDLLHLVDPMIATGGDGHCFPGATMPFGMVQLSPDTGLGDWGHCAGYRYDDPAIFAFSHTHLSGTGVGDMYDFGVLPLTETPTLAHGVRPQLTYNHSDEHSVPGYYSVKLANGVLAELTVTERTGLHRYTFPANSTPTLLLDMTETYDTNPQVLVAAEIRTMDATTITGFRQTDGWARGRKQFFAMTFSRPVVSMQIFEDATPLPGAAVNGRALRALLHFQPSAEPLEIKTGLSGVDGAGALNNLKSEAPGWAFDDHRRAASEAWQRMISRIVIEGGTARQRQIFYTSLYHALLAPTLFDDVDGRYMGMDGIVHTLPPGQHNYSTYSLWDTYRAAHPLFTVAYPEMVPLLVNGLIRMANESPKGPPVWPLQGKETLCMTGYHSAVVIAEAAIKRFPNLNLEAAWAPYSKRALTDDFDGLALYRAKGYIPCDLVSESCSKTTDYCYDDWAVAQLADVLGHKDDAKMLRQRAGNYTNLYDKDSGFIRPRLNDGSWSTPFAANEMGHMAKWRDYTESNPWQTTLAVPHDPLGLAAMLGGRPALEAKLDGIFSADPTLPPDAPSDIAGLIGQYAHGNEPSHHIAYLYVYAGAPHKTQARVRMLCETEYRNQPNGIAGNDDCGQMAAWYVLSSIGFYPVDPVSGNYVFGSPLFDRVRIGEGAKAFTIETRRKFPTDTYISGIQRNGKHQDKLWFNHSEIVAGGRYTVAMDAVPHPEFGSDLSLCPPCRSSEART